MCYNGVVVNRRRSPKSSLPSSYNEWGRTYVIEGCAYPSVTTVLGVIHIPRLQKWRITQAVERGWEASQQGATLAQAKAGENKRFPKAIHPATHLGTEVHARIEAELNGEEPKETDALILRHVASAMRFLLDINAEPVMVEQGVYHPEGLYAGTADLLCRLPDGRNAIVDWKTGRAWPRHSLQAVAYADATRLIDRPDADDYINGYDAGEAPRVDTTYMVYTREKGYYYREIPVNDPTSVFMWKSALAPFHAVNSSEYQKMSDIGESYNGYRR